MAHVEVYSTDFCAYCRAAEKLLQSKGVAFTLYNVTHDDEKRQWLRQVTHRSTVPQIFINGQPVGGFTDILALDRKGELSRLLSS